MKKIILSTLLVLSTSCSISFANELDKNTPVTPNFNQKSCQNIFSLINIDFSALSPRGTITDVVLKEEGNEIKAQKPTEVPVTDKTALINKDEASVKSKDTTSLFRLDLLKLIKIRIL